jgi:hypothetical protein
MPSLFSNAMPEQAFANLTDLTAYVKRHFVSGTIFRGQADATWDLAPLIDRQDYRNRAQVALDGEKPRDVDIFDRDRGGFIVFSRDP